MVFAVIRYRRYRLQGKADVVPGVFHVKTVFGPGGICDPRKTYLILVGEREQFVEIPVTSASRKRSIAVAWMQGLGALGMILPFFIQVSSGLELEFDIIAAIICLPSGIVCLSSLCFYYATYERATELCSHLGDHEPLYKSKIDRYFSRSDIVVQAEAVPIEDPDEEEGFHEEEIEIPKIQNPSDERAESILPIATEIV
mmetsp:Transcript_8475/g.20841  ORF Transcript_8475/g.20841 Transcript_8475/m.20841 type:complete len:199 (-) Transcript_8475:3467-4063(-)